MQKDAAGGGAGVVEKLDLLPVGKTQDVAGMVGLCGIEGKLAGMKIRDVKSSWHARHYWPPVMGWQHFG